MLAVLALPRGRSGASSCWRSSGPPSRRGRSSGARERSRTRSGRVRYGAATSTAPALRSGTIEGIDHSSLSERILPAEEWRGLPRDGVGEVVELTHVRVRFGHVDPGYVVAPLHEHVTAPVDPPRRLDAQRPVFADDAELLAARALERAGELSDGAALEAQHPAKRTCRSPSAR